MNRIKKMAHSVVLAMNGLDQQTQPSDKPKVLLPAGILVYSTPSKDGESWTKVTADGGMHREVGDNMNPSEIVVCFSTTEGNFITSLPYSGYDESSKSFKFTIPNSCKGVDMSEKPMPDNRPGFLMSSALNVSLGSESVANFESFNSLLKSGGTLDPKTVLDGYLAGRIHGDKYSPTSLKAAWGGMLSNPLVATDNAEELVKLCASENDAKAKPFLVNLNGDKNVAACVSAFKSWSSPASANEAPHEADSTFQPAAEKSAIDLSSDPKKFKKIVEDNIKTLNNAKSKLKDLV